MPSKGGCRFLTSIAKMLRKMMLSPPLFHADITLTIPNVVMKPSLEDLQSSLNKAVQIILKASQDIPQWSHMVLHQKQQQKVINYNIY